MEKGDFISGTDLDHKSFKDAEFIMVYQDALASGTRDYIQVTHVMAKDVEGKTVHARPRDIVRVSKRLGK